MLRKRSRAVASSKQPLMSDQTHVPNHKNHQTSSSFMGSPRFFNGFLPRKSGNLSPTKQNFSNFQNPFGYEYEHTKIKTQKKTQKNSLESEAIGLAIVEDSLTNPQKKMVFFGAKLKLQVPSLPSSSSSSSPKSPGDFGTKTRNLHMLTPFLSEDSGKLSKVSGKLSLNEMEQSEEYTCVITHRGPNPKTIHIFDDCVLGFSELGKNHKRLTKPCSSSSSSSSSSRCLNFLSFCNSCKKNLQQGRDIYMYRGEKAFCSNECRSQEMMCEGEE